MDIIRGDAVLRPAAEKLQPTDRFGGIQYDPNQTDWIEIAAPITASNAWTVELTDTSNGFLVDVLQMGDRIRLKQSDYSDYKYFHVVLSFKFAGIAYLSLMQSSTASTSVTGVENYINSALSITNFAYSRAKLPEGFPVSTSLARYATPNTANGQTFTGVTSGTFGQMSAAFINDYWYWEGSSANFTLGGTANTYLIIDLAFVDTTRWISGSTGSFYTYIFEGGVRKPALVSVSPSTYIAGVGTPLKLRWEKEDGTNIAAGTISLILTGFYKAYNLGNNVP